MQVTIKKLGYTVCLNVLAIVGGHFAVAQETLKIVVSDEQGQLIKNAEINVRFVTAEDSPVDQSVSLLTDSYGEAIASLPNTPLSMFEAEVSLNGFVPLKTRWSGSTSPIQFPIEHSFRLETGTKMAGIVLSPSNRPVANAKVHLHYIGTLDTDRTRTNSRNFWNYYRTTDSNGKWVSQEVPSDFYELHYKIEHPDFLELAGTLKVKSGEQRRTLVSKLEEGIEVRGVVISHAGAPAAGSVVMLGGERYANSGFLTTKAGIDGSFMFPHVAEGRCVLTAISDESAPTLKELTVGVATGEIRLELERPNRLAVKVIDSHGKLVPGVQISPEMWRGFHTLSNDHGLPKYTDDGGLWIWSAAPNDEILFSILKPGMMTLRDVNLAASEETHTIQMRRHLKVTGIVKDAITDQPVSSFQVIRGSRNATGNKVWFQQSARKFSDGMFDATFSEDHSDYFIRIDAAGYESASSRPIRADEESVKLDFRLKTGNGPEGVVLSPAGNLVADAIVVIGTREQGVQVNDGLNVTSRSNSQTRTEADGQFRLSSLGGGDYCVVVLHSLGAAVVSKLELQTNPRIELRPWAKISGAVRKPDGSIDQRHLSSVVRSSVSGVDVVFSYNTEADLRGHFVFQHVFPGTASLQSFRVDQARANGDSAIASERAEIEVVSGMTATVSLVSNPLD